MIPFTDYSILIQLKQIQILRWLINTLSILPKIEMRMFETFFSGGKIIGQPTLILLKWHFTFLAMLLEYEQSFSKASYTISACQNNLSYDIIESWKALRLWVVDSIVKLGAPSSNLSNMT